MNYDLLSAQNNIHALELTTITPPFNIIDIVTCNVSLCVVRQSFKSWFLQTDENRSMCMELVIHNGIILSNLWLEVGSVLCALLLLKQNFSTSLSWYLAVNIISNMYTRPHSFLWEAFFFPREITLHCRQDQNLCGVYTITSKILFCFQRTWICVVVWLDLAHCTFQNLAQTLCAVVICFWSPHTCRIVLANSHTLFFSDCNRNFPPLSRSGPNPYRSWASVLRTHSFTQIWLYNESTVCLKSPVLMTQFKTQISLKFDCTVN